MSHNFIKAFLINIQKKIIFYLLHQCQDFPFLFIVEIYSVIILLRILIISLIIEAFIKTIKQFIKFTKKL